MANMFTTAAVVGAAQPLAKKQKAVEIAIPGLERVAAIDALIKALTGLKEAEQGKVKGLVEDEFVENGCRLKQRPPNFRGVEGIGTAGCELKIRSSASVLSIEEVELLEEFGLPITKVDTIEACYRINPAYSGDSALLERVSKATEKVKGVPDDFIQRVEGVSVSVVAPDVLDQLFTKAEEIVRKLIGTVSSIVLKPKLADGNLRRANEIVAPLLGLQDVVESVKANAEPLARRKRA